MHPEQGQPSKIRHLYLQPAGNAAGISDYFPHYYCEAKVDIDDVRSGFHENCSVSGALRILPVDGDVVWTSDMLWGVDPSLLQPDPPEGTRLHPMPPYVNENLLAQVEMQFVLCWMRHMRARFYRNSALTVYSTAGETLADFAGRCLEVAEEPFRRDLDAAHETFNRRLELIRERFGKEIAPDELNSAGIALRMRDRIRAVSEAVDRLFLDTGLASESTQSLGCDRGEPHSDLEEKLASVHAEVCRLIRGLSDAYREKARCIDEYAVHPGLKDIHIVRTCILWMPRINAQP
jgi:hypothetical protein